MTISVIIPAYNASRWLPSAVASVCAQTRPADEIVIVDDGSTDGTRDLCRTFPKGIRYVARENGGLAAARNTGVAATSGEWILFLDADDVLLPDALASLSATADPSPSGVVYGFILQRRALATEARLHGLPYAVGVPPAPAKAHFWWTPIPTAGAALVRRSLNDEVGGFDENFRQVEDAEYWLRCGVTAPFAHCDRVVLDKSYTPASLGQQEAGSIWFRLQLQRKFLLWCEHKGIDAGFLGTNSREIADHAFLRIHRQKAWGLLDQVLAQADEMGVKSPWYWRSRITARGMKLAGMLSANPPVYPVVYSRWMESRTSSLERPPHFDGSDS
ncbi:MAG: glycosyltransferase family 2 protein [Terrimicrobiaceae bacterium]